MVFSVFIVQHDDWDGSTLDGFKEAECFWVVSMRTDRELGVLQDLRILYWIQEASGIVDVLNEAWSEVQEGSVLLLRGH
jgi:hypothetical protein